MNALQIWARACELQLRAMTAATAAFAGVLPALAYEIERDRRRAADRAEVQETLARYRRQEEIAESL